MTVKTKTNLYEKAVENTISFIKKNGYVNDQDLDRIFFDQLVMPLIKPFLPPGRDTYIFDDDFVQTCENHLYSELEKVKGMRKSYLKDPDDVTTVYALNPKNLRKAYEIEQGKINKRRALDEKFFKDGRLLDLITDLGKEAKK